MYNEKMKRIYISEKLNTTELPNNYLQRQFERTEPFERELGKDLSNWSNNNILNYYKYINTTSVDVLIVLNSALGQYTQFALTQNMVKDHQNHFLEITTEALINCLNKRFVQLKVISKKELMDVIDELLNPSDKFILLALFEGWGGKNYCDIVQARLSDLDGNIMALASGRKLKVSQRLKKYMQDSAYETKYYTMGKKNIISHLKNDTDLIFKAYQNSTDTVSDFMKSRRVYNRLARIKDFLGLSAVINGKDIRRSGMLDMIKQEMIKTNSDAINCLKNKDFKQELEYKYSRIPNPILFLRQYSDYL